MLRIMLDQISRYVVAQSGWHVKWTITVVLVYTKHKRKSQFPRGAWVLFIRIPVFFLWLSQLRVFQLHFPSCLHSQLFAQRHKAELYYSQSYLGQLSTTLGSSSYLLLMQIGLSPILRVPNSGKAAMKEHQAFLLLLWFVFNRNAALSQCWLWSVLLV